MALPYLVEKHKSSIGDKKVVYSPEATVYGNLRTSDLAKMIERSTSLTRGDVLCAIAALVDAMTLGLSLGNSVTLDGFGTISLQLKNKKGSAKPTPQEVNLSDTEGVIARFKSSRELKNNLQDIEIVRYDPKNLLNTNS